MNKNKRLIAVAILVILLLLILGIMFFNKQKNNDFEESKEQTTITNESTEHSSSLVAETPDISSADTIESENIATSEAGRDLSPSKFITDQYPDIDIIAHFEEDNSRLIEEEDRYIIVNASFGRIKESEYEEIAKSDVYLKKDAVIHYAGGYFSNDEFIDELTDMTPKEYFKENGGIRAFDVQFDENGWITEFNDGVAG